MKINGNLQPISVFVKLALLVVFFIFWTFSQHELSFYKQQFNLSYGGGIVDNLFTLTKNINLYFHQSPKLTKTLLIISSLEIDLLILVTMLYSIFYSFRPALGFMLVIVLRQLCQLIIVLPFPPDRIWYYPDFPSLFVTYDVSNDLFFSGHTASTVFCALVLGKILDGLKIRNWIVAFLIIFQIFVVVTLRLHYFMDIYAAIITAILCYVWSYKIQMPRLLN